jgi:plastocyanin
MDAPMTMARTSTRKPVSTLTKLTVVALVGLGLGLVYLQAFMIGMVIPPLAVFTVISLVIAGINLIGWRWTPLLGALWSVFLVVGNSSNIVYNLNHPAEIRGFVFTVYLVAMAIIGLVAGISAGVQNYRGQDRSAPRAMPIGLVGLAGLCLGAILVAMITQGSVAAGVSPETLQGLPGLTTANFAFDQTELRAKVGETVALRLENGDSEGHSFDIDEFNVHALIPSGESSLALFKPTAPGTYTFYCMPHYDKATGEGMKGTLIVE